MNGGLFAQGTLVPFVKLASITEPNQSFVFIEEADPRGYNIGTWAINVAPPGWVDPFAIFHGRFSSFSFADGHAERHRWLEDSTVKAATASAGGHGEFLLVRRQRSESRFRLGLGPI